MSHNPLEAEVAEMSNELERLATRRAAVFTELEWHSAFGRDAAERKVDKLTAKVHEVTQVLGRTDGDLETAEGQTASLEAKTRWGTDPRRWFSQDRAQAKTRLEEHTHRIGELKTRRSELTDRLARKRQKLEQTRRDLVRFDELDVVGATAELAALDADIPVRENQLAALTDRMEALDRQLEGAVASLEELRANLGTATSRRSSLKSNIDLWKRDIKEAQQLDKELSDAYDGSERYQVHQRSEDAFGDGKPRRVLGDRRRKLDEARSEISTLDRRIPGLERDVAKAERRVAAIARRGTRDIQSIVIDGNNLSYADSRFIGTAALRPLCAHLHERYDVTIVFDASIRHLLSGSNDERHSITDDRLRALLPDVTVHVVAARTQADDTILAAASDPSVYVLSNDKFAEFRDMPAVREDRVLRHEILNGQVMVHELDTTVTFAPDTRPLK